MFADKPGTIRFVHQPELCGSKTMRWHNKRFCPRHREDDSPPLSTNVALYLASITAFSTACCMQLPYISLFSDSAQDMQTMRLAEGINIARRHFSPKGKANRNKPRGTVQICRVPTRDDGLARQWSILSPDNVCLLGAEATSSSRGTEMT